MIRNKPSKPYQYIWQELYQALVDSGNLPLNTLELNEKGFENPSRYINYLRWKRKISIHITYRNVRDADGVLHKGIAHYCLNKRG
jgi:hypothetical protein